MNKKREISEAKKKYLESIGVDIDHLPENFEQICESMDREYSMDMRAFVNSYAAEVSVKKFCLGDIIGTDHPDYYDKSWIDFFIATKRGDGIVRKFNSNPEYYSEFLKQPKQDNSIVHDTMLELFENDGKFIIKGGNNRIAFIMMQYLKEISEAKSDEEKKVINEKYTFYGKVSTLPRDKDFVPLALYIRNKLDYRVIYGGEDGVYRCEKNGETMLLSSKEEMIEFVRDHIFGDISDGIQVMAMVQAFSTQPNFPPKIKNEIVPNYSEIVETYSSISRDIDERILLEKFDYRKDGFGGLQKILESEKERIEQEQQKQVPKDAEKQEKSVINEKEENSEEIKNARERREALRRELLEKINANKGHVSVDSSQNDRMVRTIKGEKSISREIAKDFVKMSTAQNKFISVAIKLGMLTNPFQIIDTKKYTQSINQLSQEMNEAAQMANHIDNEAKLSEIEANLDSIQALLAGGNLSQEFSEEIKFRFAQEFGSKVDTIIRNDKLSKLQIEYQKESKKKFGLIGRITGKKRLHDEKMKNLLLRQKIIKLEYESKDSSYVIEDIISDLYSYIYTAYNKEVPPHLISFVDTLDLDEDIQTLYDKKKMQGKFQEKIKANSGIGLLADIKDVSVRAQTASLLRQNIELAGDINAMARKEFGFNTFKQTVSQNRCDSMERFDQVLRNAHSLTIFINGKENQARCNDRISKDK